ncbi:hypothetical protein EJK80_09430 [Corynebacterium phoceense]|uniref:Uncharacterized protein n=1 Tax=Corynebacterium phoceense TaxID=1686286 RepID=A0A540R6B2_9CORY|nr:hypothetical protein [Corynebacterium phoceense]TQE42964.1 hypothetical protein EJK80_09430 [Corynebacterium phoceense]
MTTPPPAPDVRQFLNDESPVDLIEFLNGLFYVERVAREEGIDEGTPVGTTYFEELWGEDSPESTMALAVAAVLDPNDERKSRTQEILASREHELPAWAEGLTQASIGEVIESTQYAGDIVYYALELAIPGSEPVAVNVSIDLTETNGAIYDCFATALPLDAVRDVMRRNEDQERTMTVPVAGLKKVLSNALYLDEITIPSHENESWPLNRPLLTWVISLLPDNEAPANGQTFAAARARQENDDFSDRDKVLKEFLKAEKLTGDDRDAAEQLFEIASNYTMADLLHWSPLRIEIVLDTIARKVIAAQDYLETFPLVLERLLVWSKKQIKRPADLHTRLMEELEEQHKNFAKEVTEEPEYAEGTIGALLQKGRPRLDESPLPLEALNTEDLSPELVDRVKATGKQILRWFRTHQTADVEILTATRRLLHDVAVVRPDLISDPRYTPAQLGALIVLVTYDNSLVLIDEDSVLRGFDLAEPIDEEVEDFFEALDDIDEELARPAGYFLTSEMRRRWNVVYKTT